MLSEWTKLKGANLIITHHREVCGRTDACHNLPHHLINSTATIKMNPTVLIRKSFRGILFMVFLTNSIVQFLNYEQMSSRRVEREIHSDKDRKIRYRWKYREAKWEWRIETDIRKNENDAERGWNSERGRQTGGDRNREWVNEREMQKDEKHELKGN